MVSYLLIHHHFAWVEGAGPPPTLSTLQRSAPSSPRQTAGFVAALKAGRFVTVEEAPHDRRTKLLRPTAPLIRVIGQSGQAFVAAAEALEEGDAPLSRHLAQDADALGRLLHRSAAFVLAHGTLIHDFPRVLAFSRRDCGYLLLCRVMRAHFAAERGEAPPALSLRAVSERLQVSPAHVGNLIGEAQASGWFLVGAGGRLVAIDPGLVDEFAHWASWQMAHYRTLADDRYARSVP